MSQDIRTIMKSNLFKKNPKLVLITTEDDLDETLDDVSHLLRYIKESEDELEVFRDICKDDSRSLSIQISHQGYGGLYAAETEYEKKLIISFLESQHKQYKIDTEKEVSGVLERTGFTKSDIRNFISEYGKRKEAINEN